tara:strand:+ start:685 stop:939 length:255 start_codon:yes stop_codon:yes gene_type:complete
LQDDAKSDQIHISKITHPTSNPKGPLRQLKRAKPGGLWDPGGFVGRDGVVHGETFEKYFFEIKNFWLRFDLKIKIFNFQNQKQN